MFIKVELEKYWTLASYIFKIIFWKVLVVLLVCLKRGKQFDLLTVFFTTFISSLSYCKVTYQLLNFRKKILGIFYNRVLCFCHTKTLFFSFRTKQPIKQVSYNWNVRPQQLQRHCNWWNTFISKWKKWNVQQWRQWKRLCGKTNTNYE